MTEVIRDGKKTESCLVCSGSSESAALSVRGGQENSVSAQTMLQLNLGEMESVSTASDKHTDTGDKTVNGASWPLQCIFHTASAKDATHTLINTTP